MNAPFALKDIGQAREAIRAVFPNLKSNVGDMMDGLLSARLQMIIIDEAAFLLALKAAFYVPKEAQLHESLQMLNEAEFALYVRLVRPDGFALKAKEAISYELVKEEAKNAYNW
jgi:hypothetical protein